jgi:glycerol-3-phosphate dehydrogenase
VTIEANGVIRIGGGKYTTYRVMARDVIDTVLGREAARQRPSDTAERRLVGAADTAALARIAGELSTIAAVREIGPETSARLVARHGTEAPPVVALGAELDLLRPLVPGRPFLEAEVAWAARHELALSLDDVLSRRTRLSIELVDRGAAIAPRVAEILGAELCWSGARQALEVDVHLRRQLHVQHVARAVPPARLDPQHVLALPDHALGEQKPRGQLVVVSRRAHRDADRPPAHADLQRLLGRQLIPRGPGDDPVPTHDRAGG